MDDSTENAAAGPLGGAASTNANGALDSVNGQGSGVAAAATPSTPVTPMPPSGNGGAAAGAAGGVNGAASSTLRHQQNGASAQQQQQQPGAGHDTNGSNGTISGKSA